MASPSLPAQLRNRDLDRRRRYAQYLAFYKGDQWATPKRRTERRLTMNYVRPILTKITAYLMIGRTVTVEPDGPSDAALAAAAEVETAIMQVWQQNAADSLDFDTELDCAVLGDGAYKIYWDAAQQRVRITAPDPAGLFAWRQADDPSVLLRVANRFDLDRANVALLFPTATDVRDKNVIIDTWTADEHQVYVNDKPVINEANAYAFIPYIIFPNLREPKEVWGASDVPPLIDAQRELNRAMSQVSHILELSGNPIAVLENVNESEDINVEPGAIWTVPKDARAYILDLLKGGGVRMHNDYLDRIMRTLFDLGETPASAWGNTDRDLSGVAMELDLDPLVKKVARKRLIRTDAYTLRNDYIIRLLDQFAGTAFGQPNHTITWGTILPTDRDRQVANEVSLVGAGVHARRTATDTLGGVDDPDAEFDRWLDEQARAAAATPPPAAPPRR